MLLFFNYRKTRLHLLAEMNCACVSFSGLPLWSRAAPGTPSVLRGGYERTECIWKHRAARVCSLQPGTVQHRPFMSKLSSTSQCVHHWMAHQWCSLVATDCTKTAQRLEPLATSWRSPALRTMQVAEEDELRGGMRVEDSRTVRRPRPERQRHSRGLRAPWNWLHQH